MALDPNINTREAQKFRDAGGGLTRVGVEVEAQAPPESANTSAVSAVINVTTTAIPARAGVSNLTDRKVIMLEARTARIRWSFDPAFTATDGHQLNTNSIVSIPVGDGIEVYLRATSGATNAIYVSEVA